MNRHACEQAVDCHKHSRSDNPILMVYLSGFLGVHISWMFSSLNIAFFGLFLITFRNFFFSQAGAQHLNQENHCENN